MSVVTIPATVVFKSINADGTPRGADMGQAEIWGTEIEYLANLAYTSSLVYSTRAALYANLVPGANTPALVIGDPTAGYDGLYMKVGATTTGSWTRLGDVPGYSFIKATDAGAGTANAIVATSTPIPAADGGALIALNIFETNTASPVTVAFNGGSALTIKTNSGNDVAVGGLTAGMIVAGYKSGTTFRLLSDQASAAVLAAAEAAQAAAEAAQAAAEAAAASIEQKDFATKALAEASSPAVATDFIRVAGYSAAGDGGAALYKKVASEPSHGGKFSITLSGGGTQWYEIAEEWRNLAMLGGFASAADSVNGDAIEAAAALGNIVEVSEDISASGVDQVAVRDLVLVGGGSVSGVYRKHVIPNNAPGDAFTEIGVVPSLHCRRLSVAAAPVAVVIGDSISTYLANSLGRQNMLSEAIREHLANQLGTKTLTFYNRAIPGSIASHFLANTDGSHEWDTGGPATWASYVEALAPDIVFVSWGMNPDASGAMSYTALNAVVAEIQSWAKVPDIIFCTNLVPSMGGSAGDSKAEQEARDQGAGMIRTFALKNGFGLEDFHRKACMVRDGFDPWNTVLKKGDTIAASAGVCLGTQEVYDFRANITFDATSWAAGGADSLTVALGPGTADFMQITRNGSGNFAFGIFGGITGDSVSVSVPDSGVTMPQASQTIVVEKYRNRVIVFSEAVNFGENSAPITDTRFIGQGGLFTPRIAKSGSNVVLTSTAFRYGVPRLNIPSLTDSRMWGENFTAGAGDYGGSANNHPSGFVTSHVYRPVLMMNPLVDGNAPVAFRAHKNGTDQTYTAGSLDQKVTFGTEAFDHGGYYDVANSRFVPPAGRPVRLHAIVRLSGIVDQTFCLLGIAKNGSYVGQKSWTPSGTTNQSIDVEFIDMPNGTDYYEVMVRCTDAGDNTILGAATNTYFEGAVL